MGGIQRVDYACFRQARQAGLRVRNLLNKSIVTFLKYLLLEKQTVSFVFVYIFFFHCDLQGTFRAFLASRVQNLDTIVRSSDRDYPVVNLRVRSFYVGSRFKATYSIWMVFSGCFFRFLFIYLSFCLLSSDCVTISRFVFWLAFVFFLPPGRSVIPHVERPVPRRAGRRIRFDSSTRHLQFQQPQYLQRYRLASEGRLARSRTEWRTPTRFVLRCLDFQRCQSSRSGCLVD